MKWLDRLFCRLVGPPPESLEDTETRLKTTRDMVRELVGDDRATRALMELDEMVAEERMKRGRSGDD